MTIRGLGEMQEHTGPRSRRLIVGPLVIIAHAILFAALLIPLGSRPPLRQLPPAPAFALTRLLLLPPPASRVPAPVPTPPARETQATPPPRRQIPPPGPHPVPKPRPPAPTPPPVAASTPVPPPTNPCLSPRIGPDAPSSAPCPDTTPRLVLPGGLDAEGRIGQNPAFMAKPTTPEGLTQEKHLAERTLDKLSSLYGKPVPETPQRYESDRIPIQGTTPFQTLRGRIDRLFSPPVQKTP